MSKRLPLSKQLESLAYWLDNRFMEKNARMVRRAARLIARDIERDTTKPRSRKP